MQWVTLWLENRRLPNMQLCDTQVPQNDGGQEFKWFNDPFFFHRSSTHSKFFLKLRIFSKLQEFSPKLKDFILSSGIRQIHLLVMSKIWWKKPKEPKFNHWNFEFNHNWPFTNNKLSRVQPAVFLPCLTLVRALVYRDWGSILGQSS